jgi:hypothetical protein
MHVVSTMVPPPFKGVFVALKGTISPKPIVIWVGRLELRYLLLYVEIQSFGFPLDGSWVGGLMSIIRTKG